MKHDNKAKDKSVPVPVEGEGEKRDEVETIADPIAALEARLNTRLDTILRTVDAVSSNQVDLFKTVVNGDQEIKEILFKGFSDVSDVILNQRAELSERPLVMVPVASDVSAPEPEPEPHTGAVISATSMQRGE